MHSGNAVGGLHDGGAPTVIVLRGPSVARRTQHQDESGGGSSGSSSTEGGLRDAEYSTQIHNSPTGSRNCAPADCRPSPHPICTRVVAPHPTTARPTRPCCFPFSSTGSFQLVPSTTVAPRIR